jgi:hypothetical protein
MADISKEEVLEALESCDRRILTTSKYLGISRCKLWRLLDKYEIHVETKLGVRNKYKHNNDKVNNIYHKMVARCTNPNRKDFEYYGARGITVYEDWLKDRDAFHEYITSLENFGLDGYSLDRINNNGNYEPGNLRFVDAYEQANNKRSNRLINYSGETLTLMRFYEKYGEPLGFNYQQLLDRFKLGFSPEEAITLPKNAKRKHFFKENN